MKCAAMSEMAFQATLHLLNRSGAYLLPKSTHAVDKETDAFLLGRDELCTRGWAELDFDGKVIPSKEYARLIYDIAHAEASLRLESPDQAQWYLLAPTEMLFIEQAGDSFRLERRKGQTLMPWLRENALAVVEGTLTTLRSDQTRNALLGQFEPDSQSRATEIVKHLSLFFGREEDHA